MTHDATGPSPFSASVANGGGIVDKVYLALSGRQIGLLSVPFFLMLSMTASFSLLNDPLESPWTWGDFTAVQTLNNHCRGLRSTSLDPENCME